MIKLQEFFSKYLTRTVAIVIGIIGVLSFFITAYFKATYQDAMETTFYKMDPILWNILGIIMALGIILFYMKVSKKVNIWVLLSIVLGVSFITQMIYIFQIKFIPLSDQYNLCYYANLMLDGKIKDIFVPGSYLNEYPFQTWLAGFIAILFKVFGRDNYLIFQVLNVIASISNMAILFLMTRKLFRSEMVQKLVLVLFLGFNLYFVFFNVHVYGNIIGLTFALLAIYMMMKYMTDDHGIWLIISGISITIAIFFKSNYNIFLCAIIFTLLLYAMHKKSWRPCIYMMGVVVIYIGITRFSTMWLENKIEQPLPDGVPMLSYVYMGIMDSDTSTSGWYTMDTLKIYHQNKEDAEAALQETKTLLKNRISYLLKHPKYTLHYIADKEASTWLNPTFQTIWCSLPTNITFESHPEYQQYFESKKGLIEMLDGKWYHIEEGYFNIYQILIFGFSAVGLLLYTRKKMTPIGTIIPMLFVGGFVFHLIWETKSIYVLQYYFLLLPFAAYGIYECVRLACNKRSNKRLLAEVQE